MKKKIIKNIMNNITNIYKFTVGPLHEAIGYYFFINIF